jgi:hypothetical protein
VGRRGPFGAQAQPEFKKRLPRSMEFWFGIVLETTLPYV